MSSFNSIPTFLVLVVWMNCLGILHGKVTSEPSLDYLEMKTTLSHVVSCNMTSLSKCRCYGYFGSNDVGVDCSNSGFKNANAAYPKHTVFLKLDSNNITTLGRNSFVDPNGNSLENLKYLDLSNNNLSNIEDLAFDGLNALTTLLLFDNNLYQALQTNTLMFEPLKYNLKVLDLRRNIQDECNTCQRYPGATVGVLGNLTDLYMDGIDKTSLDADFRSLGNLRKLVFSGGRGNVAYIGNTMFEAVPMITELDVSGIGIGLWDLHVLKFLPNLTVLNLCNNPSLGTSVFNVRDGLKWAPIEELYLNNTGIGDLIEPFLHYLLIDTNYTMRVLTLDSNFIYDFNTFFSKRLPNLEILSLGNNYWNPRSTFFADFFMLKHLVGLNISCQQGSTTGGHSRKKRRYKNPYNQLHFCQLGTACPLNLPRNLKWVDLSHFGFQLPEVPEAVFLTNSSLNYLNLAWTGVTAVPFMVFCPASLNIVPKLQTWDFSSSSLQCINASVFSNCSMDALENLLLGGNHLGSSGENVCNNPPGANLDFIKPVHNLKVLDLQENGLDGQISQDIFANTTKLRSVNLAGNGLKEFNLNLNNLVDLEFLDLARNNLKCLSEDVTRSLDRLQRKKQDEGTIKVDLSKNPLMCNCSCLHFYKWLARTRVEVLNLRSYECRFPDGSTLKLRRLNTVLAKLDTDCSNTRALEAAWVVTGLINFLVVIFTVTFRLRHEIRYLWLRMRMRRQRLDELLGQHDFKYAAFISCDARDAAKYVKNGILTSLETTETSFKFCVAQRDFVVGATIIDNIVRAIYSSRKVIFLITPNFLQSGWCKEELLIAHNESLSRGKNILICVFTPEVERRHLPDNIAMITRTVTCLRWPDATTALKVFYLMLYNALTDGTTGQ